MGSLIPQQRLSHSVAQANNAKRMLRRSVLFVCWGNLCRSPAAASVFQKFLDNKPFPSLEVFVDSAGVDDVASDAKPTIAMRWAAFRRGYRLRRPARRIRRPELDEFDLVIAMDRKVFSSLQTVHESPSAKICLLSDFLPPGMPRDVPDPMFRTTRTCNRVLDMLELASPKIAAYLMKCCVR